MKICVPTDSDQGLNATRGAHFGRAAFYTIVEVKEQQIVAVTTFKNGGHAQGGCALAVENIKQLGADVLVVIGIGQSPLVKFRQEGINVYLDRQAVTVQECVERLMQQQLSPLSPAQACGAKI